MGIFKNTRFNAGYLTASKHSTLDFLTLPLPVLIAM